MAAFFSEDICIEILKRLPVLSLIKIRLVQKSWYHLVQSPYFKTLYSHHNKNTYILFRCGRSISLRDNDKQCNHYSSPPLPKDIERDCYDFYAISNGLICFHDSAESQQIHLWNPVIRKYITLSDSPVLFDDPLRRPAMEGLAFGYLPKIDDYKVIKIENYYGVRKHSDFVCVYIYSLGTNSWKTVISKDRFFEFEFLGEDSIVVNGVAYWIGASEDYIKLIVCFDIESEIIREIMLPPQFKHVYDEDVTLVQKSGDLSLFHDYRRVLNIWILETEGEINDVWTKKFTLHKDRLGDIWSWWPGNFRNDDEIILTKHSDSGHGYMSYDIEKDEPTAIIDNLPNLCSSLDVNPGIIHASLFVENLVLLGDN